MSLDIKKYIETKPLQEEDSENLIYELKNTDIRKTPNKALHLIKKISERDEEAAKMFIERLEEKYQEIAEDMGI